MNKRKKSNNPFRMWESWVGFGLGPTIVYIIYKITYHSCTGTTWCFEDLARFGAIVIGAILAIVGFFLGWGIHSLRRRYSK